MQVLLLIRLTHSKFTANLLANFTVKTPLDVFLVYLEHIKQIYSAFLWVISCISVG